MPTVPGLTPGQCRAARGLLDWTQDELAKRAGLSRSTVRDFEKGRHDLHAGSARRIVGALEDAGVLLIPAGAAGPGVCLAAAEAGGD
ncbi:helix-turn-helix transcriptional regulator [Azospirillum sp.]|uniref:helix-turn-helix transcriptional regulator n=1 Tax=Azospirillum sp. TaxID=34012 RepID=UPI002D758B54|nr:helix-turn-helix transcriptional regulator [Azospirillum sp.]HYD69200.1 helix-turn-helix transcriptional regulator [Azospirillum sp.]